MKRRNPGFSILELLLVVAIIGIIAAFALPSAINFVKSYRLHADASAISSQLNVTRFRATSQYTPYRVRFDVPNRLFFMERLAHDYSGPTAEIALGLQQGISFLAACPAGTRPGTVTSSFSASSGSIYFNTRGLPVDSTGAPTNNNVIYLKNDNDLYDAVTVSLGGRITVWNYNAATSTWISR